MKKAFILLTMTLITTVVVAQTRSADDVLSVARKVNNHFMAKHADPTLDTNVGRIRPSSLWTRGVYYEGLMALYDIDPDSRYITYTDLWGNYHHWTPRNGITTTDADDQCCAHGLTPYRWPCPSTARCTVRVVTVVILTTP